MRRSSSYLNSFILPLAAATLLLCLAPSLHAQERLPAEEILRFFPMGDYEQIDHEETAALMASKHLDTFKQFRKFSWDRRREPFPEEFMNAAESITHARKTRVFVYAWKPGETKFFSKGRGVRGSMMDVGNVTYAAEGVGEELYVLRFLDLPAALKKFSDAGVVSDSGETLGNLPIYMVRKENSIGGEFTMQMVALKTGELLAAENRPTLKRMLETARGQEVSILGDPTYLTFEEDMLALGGQRFRWGTQKHIRDAIFKYAAKKGHSEAEIEQAKDSARDKRFLQSASVWDLSDPAVEKDIQVFESETPIRKRFRSGRSGTSFGGVWKTSIDGLMVIRTTTYEIDAIREFNLKREQIMKELEQQQKEKEEKSDEKK